MRFRQFVAAGLVTSMLASMPVYAAPQGDSWNEVSVVITPAGTNAGAVQTGPTTETIVGTTITPAPTTETIIGTTITPAPTTETIIGTTVTPAPTTETTTAATQAPATVFELYIQQVLSGIVTADMPADQQLLAAWNWLLNYASYKRTYETPSGDWTQQYAQEILTSGQGNCYRYAAAFAYLAKEIGCDVKVVTGQINAARGGVTPHAWCVITVNGTEYICDPDMADAKNSPNAYYMVTFDQYPVKPLIAQNTWEIHF